MEMNIDQIQSEVNHLTGQTLSIYLYINPASEEWRIHLKNGLKKIAEDAKDSGDEEEKNSILNMCKKVDKAIKDNKANFKKSVICFANEEELLMYDLQIPVDHDFQCQEGPATLQLDRLMKDYPRSGVILLQHDQVTLITTALGELIDETHFTLDLEREDWKEYKGIAYGSVHASGANHKDKFDQRVKENQVRWLKKIIPTVEKHAKEFDWKNTYLAGPTELTNEIYEQINLEITGETFRNYAGKSAQDILDKTILATND